jgi:energy-coupling factor transporter transmembrane protein EcfT
MIKKIFILVFVLLFLTSCGDDESIVSGLTPIENPHFYFSIPSNWKILSST